MIFSIAIAGVIYNDWYLRWRIYYFMPGSYGSFFGLIAGPLGICGSNSKRLSTTKCHWIAHIILVFDIHQLTLDFDKLFKCIFTILGSLLGFSFGSLGTFEMADGWNWVCRYYNGSYDYDLDVKCLVLYPAMAIETIFCLGRS